MTKQISVYTIIGGLIATLFIPFIVADTQLFPFITGKAFVFRILVEILFGVWLIAMFRDPEIRPRDSWITRAILLFGGVVILADIFGVSFYRSFWSNFERMDGLISLLHLLAYFFVAGAVLNTRARWQIFFNTSVVSSVIMSFYVFLQLAGKIVINQGGVRVDGTFGNAAYLAVFMLCNFFIALFLMVRLWQNGQQHSKVWLYCWYVLAAVFQIIVLYYTATRGAILGLIGGLMLSSLVLALWGKKEPQLRKISIAILVGVLVLVSGFFAIRKTDFVAESPTLSRFATLSPQEINKQGRRYVWPMAIEGFKERPILGWGQENFGAVFAKHYDPRMYNQEPWFDRAHNIVLDWLVAGGLLGLLSYLGLFAALLYLLWKNQTLSVAEKSILLGFIAAYFFQNLFVFDNLISYLYFFSLLAFVHAENVRGKSEPQWLARLSQYKPLALIVVPIIVGIACVFVIYSWNIKPISANRTLIKAISFNVVTPEQSLEYFRKIYGYNTFANGEASEQLFNQFRIFTGQNAGVETQKAYVALATEKMAEQTARFPKDVRTLLFMGSLQNRIGAYQNALPYLERARAESPQKQTVLFEIGLSYLSLGDLAKATETFKTAYDLAPDFAEARILYAAAAIYSKNVPLTKELLAPLDDASLAREERLISAYAANGQMADAVRLVEKRVALDPNVPENRFRLAAGYLALGQRTKAIEVLTEVTKLFPIAKQQAEYYIKEIQAGKNPK